MKNKIITAIAIFFGMVLSSQETVAQTLSLNSTNGHNLQVGSSMTIYLAGNSSCNSPTVSGSLSWSINPSTADTTYSSKFKTLTVRWHSAVSASVTVTYKCSAGGNAETTSPYNVNVTYGTQSFTPALSTNSVCQDGSITISATNVVNGGDSPIFTYRLDSETGQEFYSGSSNGAKTVPTSSPGNHTVYAWMYGSNSGMTTGPVQLPFYVTPKKTFAINSFYIQGVICSTNKVAPVSVNVSDISGQNPGITSYTFEYLINGATATGASGEANPTNLNYFTYASVNANDYLEVKVTPNGSCVASTQISSKIYVNIANSSPVTDIIPSFTSFGTKIPDGTTLCDGTTIYLRSSQAGTNYSWSVPGKGNIREISMTVSTDEQSSGTFKQSSLVSLTVTGITGGACLVGSTASDNISGSLFTIEQNPGSEIIPSGNILIRSDASQKLTAPTGAGISYQWLYRNSSGPFAAIPGAADDHEYTTDVAGSYKVKATRGACSSTSTMETTIAVNTLPDLYADAVRSFNLSNLGTITATGSDAEGTVSYLWTVVSAPAAPVVTGTSTSAVSISDATVGAYVFRVKATDELGEFVTKDVRVYIYPIDNYNLVKENIVNVAGKLSADDVAASPIGERNQVATYFDGFGRPIQKVSMASTPQSHDLIEIFAYDVFNREKVKYLPFPSTQQTGLYNADILPSNVDYNASPHGTFYQNSFNDEPGYAVSKFDNSPLNRILEQGSAGADWQTHTVKHAYLTNDQYEIILFKYDATINSVSVVPGAEYYPANEFTVNQTTDEQGNVIKTFVDKEGRTVCKKVKFSETVTATTYYIYDDFGNLVLVIQPEGINIIESQINTH